MRGPRTVREWIEWITAPVWFPLFLLAALLTYVAGWFSATIDALIERRVK